MIRVKPALKPPQTPFKIMDKIGWEADRAGSTGLIKLKLLEIKLDKLFPIKKVQSSKPAITPTEVKYPHTLWVVNQSSFSEKLLLISLCWSVEAAIELARAYRSEAITEKHAS